jgi:hypothetical protein
VLGSRLPTHIAQALALLSVYNIQRGPLTLNDDESDSKFVSLTSVETLGMFPAQCPIVVKQVILLGVRMSRAPPPACAVWCGH